MRGSGGARDSPEKWLSSNVRIRLKSTFARRRKWREAAVCSKQPKGPIRVKSGYAPLRGTFVARAPDRSPQDGSPRQFGVDAQAGPSPIPPDLMVAANRGPIVPSEAHMADDPPIRIGLGERARTDDLTVRDQAEVLGDPADEIDILLDEQNRRPALPMVGPEDIPDPV